MAKKHLKRVAMPKTWNLPRRDTVYIERPYPGGASLEFTMSLGLVLRELIKCAKTSKEVKRILQEKEVTLNGARRYDPKSPVCLMDVIGIKETQEAYRLVLDAKGRLTTLEVPTKERELVPSKLSGKTITKKGLSQLNFFNGRNILVKDAKKYAVGDTLVLGAKNEIKEHLPLTEGTLVCLLGGSHKGQIVRITEIKGAIITIELPSGTFATAKCYAFPIGKTQPVISLQKTA